MNQYDAIFNRRCVKSFRTEKINDRGISQILNFANYITDISGKNSVNFEVWSSTEKEKMMEHHFSVKAPHYFVLSTESTEDRFLNLGFVLEQVALYLVTKDLGSCFAGIHKEKKQKQQETSRILAVLAFGIPADGSAKRMRTLPIEHLCVFKDKADAGIKDMISAAVLAPSRLNSQPWRFVVYKNRIHVFRKKERFVLKTSTTDWYQEFDMGMMLANLLVAGEELWYNIEIVNNETIAEKELKNNIYMFTVIVTEQQSDFEAMKDM